MGSYFENGSDSIVSISSAIGGYFGAKIGSIFGRVGAKIGTVIGNALCSELAKLFVEFIYSKFFNINQDAYHFKYAEC